MKHTSKDGVVYYDNCTFIFRDGSRCGGLRRDHDTMGHQFESKSWTSEEIDPEADFSRIQELEDAIRLHREKSRGADEFGVTQCWENDEELWKVLGDGDYRYPRELTPTYDVMMQQCHNYCVSRQVGEAREISKEELLRFIKNLQFFSKIQREAEAWTENAGMGER